MYIYNIYEYITYIYMNKPETLHQAKLQEEAKAAQDAAQLRAKAAFPVVREDYLQQQV